MQVDRLRRACAGWSTRRWSADALSTWESRSKADVAYDLAQQLADIGADAEGVQRRLVPRLADPVLLDQIRTLAHDVLGAGNDEAVRVALQTVRVVRSAIDGSRPS